MKNFILFILLFSPFLTIQAQYTENFGTLNKGIQSPGCTGATLATCTNTDFSGETWTLDGDFTEVDTEGLLTAANPNNSNNTALFGADVDREVCWVSPALTASAGVGTSVSFSVDVNMDGYDGTDYLDLEYQTDGATWVQVPNISGGGTHTIQTNGASIDFDATANSGTFVTTTATVSVRVCFDHNSVTENTYIDNISVTNASLILPVELIDFQAKAARSKIILDWITASEINNNYFEIQRSTDGNNFETIGIVNGKGTIETISNYDFIDEKPMRGVNYYRLKQVDYNGQFEYSKVISVELSNDQIVAVYPNPFDQSVTIQLPSTDNGFSANQDWTIEVVDVYGKLVHSILVPTSETNTTLNLSDLISGTYFIRTIDATQHIHATQRIVKL